MGNLGLFVRLSFFFSFFFSFGHAIIYFSHFLVLDTWYNFWSSFFLFLTKLPFFPAGQGPQILEAIYKVHTSFYVFLIFF